MPSGHKSRAGIMAGAVGAAKTSTSKVEGSPSAECLRSRRRREAAKAALFHLENSVHQAALELRALHKEREALNDEELALTQLTEHQAQLYAALSAAHAARALRESRMVGEGAANEVERLVVHAFNTGEYPNDEWFSKKYLSFPVELMVRIEKTFMSLLDNTMAQWKLRPEARPGIEHRLTTLFTARRFASQLLLEERPEVHRVLACNSGPGVSTTEGSIDWFASLVETLNITDEQRELMLPSWRQYQEVLDVLQQQALEMQQVLAAGGAVNSLANGATSPSNANAFLAVTEATTWLHNYPCKVLSTYGFLILGIASQLKATQHAMLVLGCQPYAPDYVRLCTVLLEKGGGPGAGVRRHLPCIELN